MHECACLGLKSHNSDAWLHYACHTLLVGFSVCGSEMIFVSIFIQPKVNTFIYIVLLNRSAEFHFHLGVILFVVLKCSVWELHVHAQRTQQVIFCSFTNAHATLCFITIN